MCICQRSSTRYNERYIAIAANRKNHKQRVKLFNLRRFDTHNLTDRTEISQEY